VVPHDATRRYKMGCAVVVLRQVQPAEFPVTRAVEQAVGLGGSSHRRNQSGNVEHIWRCVDRRGTERELERNTQNSTTAPSTPRPSPYFSAARRATIASSVRRLRRRTNGVSRSRRGGGGVKAVNVSGGSWRRRSAASFPNITKETREVSAADLSGDYAHRRR
jgi:hypothetical protein